eukprot:TRINITY_DN4526_c0_g1_i1.p1 TRINITY_DN4526_c0_g1~~TRINITY_DN4526_c0_g1_i1.p1  ORF type:complete len:166 (+),score=30.29 TRINITY_DN4526_c0_g1_i1:114-611(+)
MRTSPGIFLIPVLLGIGLIKVSRIYEVAERLSRSNEAFVFVKDFRNYQELNPLITSIVITEESPSHQIAEYEELFETLPSFINNFSVGSFNIDPHEQSITSTHSTCLLAGTFYCLTTQSFLSLEQGLLKLKIEYECPFALTPVCRAEIVSQQSKILKSLKKKFDA